MHSEFLETITKKVFAEFVLENSKTYPSKQGGLQVTLKTRIQEAFGSKLDQLF
jgi:hypothetical protein